MRRWLAIAGLAALVASGVQVAAARAADNPWGAGANWIYLRAGFAHSSVDGGGNGGAGYGMGFRHMLKPSHVNEWRVLGVKPLGFLRWTVFRDWSLGGSVEYNVVGRYGSASEIEIPATFDMTRYILWKSEAKPYVTLGFGPYYRKLYNTGSDLSKIVPSAFLGTGFDMPVSNHQLVGFDLRMARVASENKPVNPVFGGGSYISNHWSFKVAYAVTY